MDAMDEQQQQERHHQRFRTRHVPAPTPESVTVRRELLAALDAARAKLPGESDVAHVARLATLRAAGVDVVIGGGDATSPLSLSSILNEPPSPTSEGSAGRSAKRPRRRHHRRCSEPVCPTECPPDAPTATFNEPSLAGHVVLTGQAAVNARCCGSPGCTRRCKVRDGAGEHWLCAAHSSRSAKTVRISPTGAKGTQQLCTARDAYGLLSMCAQSSCKSVPSSETSHIDEHAIVSPIVSLKEEGPAEASTKGMLCVKDGCERTATFGEAGGPPRFCVEHRRVADVVERKVCSHKGCTNCASAFGDPEAAGKLLFCELHRNEEREHLKLDPRKFRVCRAPEVCDSVAIYGKRRGFPMFCELHMRPGDIKMPAFPLQPGDIEDHWEIRGVQRAGMETGGSQFESIKRKVYDAEKQLAESSEDEKVSETDIKVARWQSDRKKLPSKRFSPQRERASDCVEDGSDSDTTSFSYSD